MSKGHNKHHSREESRRSRRSTLAEDSAAVLKAVDKMRSHRDLTNHEFAAADRGARHLGLDLDLSS